MQDLKTELNAILTGKGVMSGCLRILLGLLMSLVYKAINLTAKRSARCHLVGLTTSALAAISLFKLPEMSPAPKALG